MENWPSSNNRNPIRILTNFERFPLHWKCLERAGTAQIVHGARQLLWNSSDADLILINGDVYGVLLLVMAFRLFPFFRKPLVAVDLVLRKPEGWRSQLAAWIKKKLLARVDHFVHYFRNLEGYRKYYGIDADRSSFVHFKANLYDGLKNQTMRRRFQGRILRVFAPMARDFHSRRRVE